MRGGQLRGRVGVAAPHNDPGDTECNRRKEKQPQEQHDPRVGERDCEIAGLLEVIHPQTGHDRISSRGARAFSLSSRKPADSAKDRGRGEDWKPEEPGDRHRHDTRGGPVAQWLHRAGPAP